ncbi:hypothetical protein SRABI05_00080 [Agrobacterium fabrum]|uniref:hypothetical protein n=1 Tax=Agrobacterium fabrum TaxID=1176649 RepID=UPI001DA88C7D|nr:hypothetical protein [Agrobacterium fabrum]CAH0132416.1 hypothetical protein SRABI05_00080 [Agrobacterium fabrum]CAH0151905.1 hypothetical protein SRABI46_00795 [Agrobacterium fabrum]
MTDEIEFDILEPVRNELAERAPLKDVLLNWRIWWPFPVLLILSACLFFAGVSLSIKFQDWGMLGRFGAFLSVIGSYLVARPVWRIRYKSRYVFVTILKNGRLAPEELTEQMMHRVDVWAFFSGFFIAAVGTAIWGFADLLNCLSFSAKCTFAM